MNPADSSGDIAAEIAKRAEQAERELAALKDESTVTDDLVREVAATSPAELRTEISKRESLIIELQHDRVRLQQRQKHLDALQKAAAAEQFDLEPLREEKTLADRATADLERQVDQERRENRVAFTLPQGCQKEGWLAVIEADRIVAAPIGRPSKPVEFRATGVLLFGKSAADQFGGWIGQQGLQSAYFLLLVRPGAASMFDDAERMLTTGSVSHGFDLVSRDAMIIHPERGAAP